MNFFENAYDAERTPKIVTLIQKLKLSEGSNIMLEGNKHTITKITHEVKVILNV